MNKTKKTLEKLFERFRIVFWYDSKAELHEQFRQLELDGVEKIHLENNQLTVKYRMLRQYPNKKFLLYFRGPEPEPHQNWLLDVQLAHVQFKTHPMAIWLGDLNIDLKMETGLAPYKDFFKEKKRRDKLKKALEPGDSLQVIRLKMLAAVTGDQPTIDSITEQLLQELAENKDNNKNNKMQQLRDYRLEPFFWEQIAMHYGYRPQTPELEDFALSLFKFAYERYTGDSPLSRHTPGPSLSGDALVFLNRWKESRFHRPAFEALSQRFQERLGIAHDLPRIDYRVFRDLDIYSLIDRKIVEELAAGVSRQTIAPADCQRIVRQRRQSFWYPVFQDYYSAVSNASLFLESLRQIHISLESFSQGLERYAGSWFQTDQYYRKYCFHRDNLKESQLLDNLTGKIEREYLEKFLIKLNRAWNKTIDPAKTWKEPGSQYQKNFFQDRVKPFLDKSRKVCVIVSPALRYEAGHELLNRLLQDRFQAKIEAALAILPVNRSLINLAAVLPHEKLTTAVNPGHEVLVDGCAAENITGYQAILRNRVPRGAAAVKAGQLLEMNKDTRRALIKKHRLIYIYHYPPGADDRGEEHPARLFNAIERSLEDIMAAVKKLVNAGVTNLLVTSARGFLHHGGEDAALRRGATLQEAVVPVIHINRKSSDVVSEVGVDILNGSAGVITTGQLCAAFYQVKPVDNKTKARELLAGIYTEEDRLISDTHRIVFDLSSPNMREREIKRTFILTREAKEVNNQYVHLRLIEPKKEGTCYPPYKSRSYLLRPMFVND